MAKNMPQTGIEFIMPVNELTSKILGECVVNKIRDFIRCNARGFGKSLNDQATVDKACNVAGDYFAGMSEEVRFRIAEVRLTLNDYVKKLGIGLVSVNIEMEDEDENAWLPKGELKPPTLGVVKPKSARDTQVLVGFKVDEGAEQITVLSNILHARGFLPGENISPTLQTLPYPWQRGQIVTVPQSAMVGLNVPVVDMGKLAESGIPFRLGYDMARSRPSQVYFCRHLTQDAARKVLGLDYANDEGPGPLAPHWQRDESREC